MSWRDNLRQVEPYVAGEQPKMKNLIKLNTNENPYDPGEKVREAIQRFDANRLRLYPNADAENLRHALASYHHLEDEQVFIGNGSDEVLALTFLTCFNGEKPILFPDITYSFYPVYCELYQIDYHKVPLCDDFTINKEDYKRARKFRAGRVVYVPGVGIDINKFSKRIDNRDEKRSELGFKPADFVLLSVGELIARKNHAVVLEGLAELKKAGKLDNIQYVICGRGVLDTKLKEKAVILGISDHVHFLGYRNDVNEICNAADLFVFMSLQEGLPVALMEAMACGLPAICSDIRGNTDLIESGKNGEIVENTAVVVAGAIERLKNDGALRNQYAIEAAITIKHFDLSSVETYVRGIYTDKIP